MRKSRGKFDAQAVADIPLRRSTPQPTSWIALYDRDLGRRPFVEGLPIQDLIALIQEQLEIPPAVVVPPIDPGDEELLAAGGTVELVELVGTSGELLHTPDQEPLVVIEAAHTILSLASSSIPAANEYFRDGMAMHVNVARADSILKVAYPYRTPVINPGFEPFAAVGVTVTLTEVPEVPPLLVYPDGHIILTETATPMGPNHFTRVGRVLTLDPARADISGTAIYTFNPTTLLKQESLDPGGYPTFDATLAEVPADDELVLAIYGPANLPLAYTAGAVGVNDFTVVGTALTSGREMTGENQIHVLYPYT